MFVNVDKVGMSCFQMLETFDPAGALISQEKTLYAGIIATAAKGEYHYDTYICGSIGGEKKIIDIGKQVDSQLAKQEYEKDHIKVTKREVGVFGTGLATGDLKETKPHQIQEELISKNTKHPWIDKLTPYNMFRSRPVFMVPSHIPIKTLSKVLLKQVVPLTTSALTDGDISEMTVADVYAKFMSNIVKSERANNVLDFEYSSESLTSQPTIERIENVQYEPKHTFFGFFQEHGGVVRLFAVALQCVSTWQNQQLKESC
jgi:hypothetical protein